MQLNSIRTLLLPKIHSASDLHTVSRKIHANLGSSIVKNERKRPINIVASIESARALVNIGEIAGWQSEFGPLLGGKLTALLVSTMSSNFRDVANEARNSLLQRTVCSIHLRRLVTTDMSG